MPRRDASSKPSGPARRGHVDLRAASVAVFVALLLVALLLVAATAVRTRLTAWDDAFMFVRYADRLRTTGAIAWNPHGPPTYGLTSILYLLVVVAPVRTVLSGDPYPALVASSCVCGAGFLALGLRLAWRASDGLSRAARLNVVLLVIASLLMQGETLAFHAASGMDTSFAMAFEAAYLLLALRSEERGKLGGARLAIPLGLVGGLAIAARPDLALFSFAVPLVGMTSRDRTRARAGAVALATTVAVSLLWLLAARAYFGSALPLSFYAKSTALYRDFNVGRYAPVPLEQWKAFALPNGILLALGAFPVVFAPRAWLRDAPSAVKGSLVAVVLFTAYYLTSVLQIMNAHARFYYPMLPAVVLVGAYGARCLLARTREVPLLFSFALGAAVLPPKEDMLRPRPDVLKDDLLFSYRISLGHVLLGLDRISLLPDDLVIAATEVGHLGVMNPGKTVIDMTGLNDTEIARHGFSAAQLFARAPDLIYMPHPDYRGMVNAILADPTFREGYELRHGEDVGALGIAIRRASPHYDAMKQIVDDAWHK